MTDTSSSRIANELLEGPSQQEPHGPSESHRPHGSYVKYTIENCRCAECRFAASEYNRSLSRRKAYGGTYWGWTDAEPVRAHVRSLMAPRRRGNTRGMGWKRIADKAGVSRSTMWKLIYGPKDRGPSKRIRLDIADKLLAVEQDLADGASVPAHETNRYVDELVVWYNAEIGTPSGNGMGRHPYGGKAWLGRLLSGNPETKSLQLSRKWVSVANARKVKAIHDQAYREHESFRWRYCKHDVRSGVEVA